LYVGPTAFLRQADDTVWSYRMDEINVKREPGGARRLPDVRTFGLSYKPSETTEFTDVIDEALPGSDVRFSEERDVDGTYVVHATAGSSDVVWHIDPSLGWNATRCELWVDGVLARFSETEYQETNGVFLPTACAYSDGRGRVLSMLTVESAKVNDPSLPRSLAPEHIGIELGMIVRTTGEAEQQTYVGSGRVLPSLKAYMMERRGELEFGPKMKAHRMGKPIDWSIPDPAEMTVQPPPVFDDKLDDWQKCTLDFINLHKLDEGQRQRAYAILRSCELQRDHYLRLKRPRIDEMEKRLGEGAAASAVREEVAKLRAPVQQVFEKQLKPRLEGLLTRSQRAAAQGEAP
jgi:hypothetical protein